MRSRILGPVWSLELLPAAAQPAILFRFLKTALVISDSEMVIAGADPIGDLDGDGFADLAINGTRDGNGRVVVLAGRTNGTLAPLYQIELGPMNSGDRVQLGAGDLDADGTRDLVVFQQGTHRDGRLLIFLQPFASKKTGK